MRCCLPLLLTPGPRRPPSSKCGLSVSIKCARTPGSQTALSETLLECLSVPLSAQAPLSPPCPLPLLSVLLSPWSPRSPLVPGSWPISPPPGPRSARRPHAHQRLTAARLPPQARSLPLTHLPGLAGAAPSRGRAWACGLPVAPAPGRPRPSACSSCLRHTSPGGRARGRLFYARPLLRPAFYMVPAFFAFRMRFTGLDCRRVRLHCRLASGLPRGRQPSQVAPPLQCPPPAGQAREGGVPRPGRPHHRGLGPPAPSRRRAGRRGLVLHLG